MSDENSFAQEQQPVAENTEQPQTQEVAPAASGVQQRIDELTAKYHAAERQREAEVAARDAQIASLIQAMAQVGNRQEAPPPQLEIEPELRKQMEYVAAPLNQGYAQLQAQVQQLIQMQEFNAAAAGYPQDIQAEAQKLMGVWSKNKYSGWKPVDALVYAAGQKALAGHKDASSAKAQAQDFNKLPGAVTQQAAPTVNTQRKGLPQNFNNLPAQKQAEILEQETEDFSLF